MLNQLVAQWSISSSKIDLFLPSSFFKFPLTHRLCASPLQTSSTRMAQPTLPDAWTRLVLPDASPGASFPADENRWSGPCHAHAVESHWKWLVCESYSCVTVSSQGPKLHLFQACRFREEEKSQEKTRGSDYSKLPTKGRVIGGLQVEIRQLLKFYWKRLQAPVPRCLG